MTHWLSSWRRLIGTTSVCFALLLALLAWRVSAGEDPVLAASTQQAVPATTSTSSASTQTQSSTPTTQAS